MTTQEDVCNRALSEIGARATIASLASDTTPQAVTCNLHYVACRQQLIRTAPWGFTRKTIPLPQDSSFYAQPALTPYPWRFKYAVPPDCLKFRYILRPPLNFPRGVITDQNLNPLIDSSGNWITDQTGNSDTTPPVVGTPVYFTPWAGPSRANRFIISNDDTSNTDVNVLLSNVDLAFGVYNKDIVSPNNWDPLFTDAMVALIAYKVCLPLGGKGSLKSAFKQIVTDAINAARLADGNEAIASSDHIPDWIQTRGAGSPWGYSPAAYPGFEGQGLWCNQWDNMSWGS